MTTRATIRPEGDKLLLESEWIPAEAEGTEAYGIGQTTVVEVTPVDQHTLVPAGTIAESRGTRWMFLDPDAQDKFRLMYAGTRLARRIA